VKFIRRFYWVEHRSNILSPGYNDSKTVNQIVSGSSPGGRALVEKFTDCGIFLCVLLLEPSPRLPISGISGLGTML